MPVSQVTQKPTESDLEARLRETLRHVFPWLEADSISH